MITNAKILITGGYGFIGGHLAQVLAEETLHNDIVIFDFHTGEHTTGDDFNFPENRHITTIQGSVLDAQALAALADDFDYVVHAAGFLGIEKVAEQQLETMDINILGTRSCLDLLTRQKKNPPSLFFSTSEIYGINCPQPSENDDSVIATVGKRWCYAASKIAAEYYVKAYIQRYGIRGSIVRPFNVFGAHRYGTNAMTNIVTRAVKNEEILISGDGQQIRSWCSIEDFCNGVIAILEQGEGSGEAYNIGNPKNKLTMEALAHKVVTVTGSSSKITIQHNDTEDVKLRIPNIAKAIQTLGYNPKQDFDASIRSVAEWLKATGQA